MNEELQQQLTIKVMQVMESWKLTDIEKIALLKLEEKVKPRHLYQYQRGTKLFEFDNILIERIKILIGIDAALGTSYPANQNYGQIWMRREQRKFKGKTPLDLMLRNKVGMERVWHFLDCTQSWRN